MTDVLFYGKWPGSSFGHHARLPGGRMIEGGLALGIELAKLRPGGLYPWDHEWSMRHTRAQNEGKLWYWHHPTKPMTLLLSWDRSEDRRGGSAATFIVMDRVEPERALELARASFPRVFARIEQHVGHPVVLDGPAAEHARAS